ncbi:glycosyltransferase [Promicromonospora panici]|uniref:glycosyltransferase n=1 Tax=Promicromonospora panici TaxID=2219658 RepID=UPI001F5D737B|nr:glycosyltransferase family 2 protein [Promicromonospora panici]
MIQVLTAFTLVVGVTMLVVGIVRLLMVPFAVRYEIRRPRRPSGAPPHAGTIFDRPDRTAPPSISVIVPAYNESVVVENCVRSIVRSRYPDFEVVCVDDGSSDDTYAKLQALAAELPGVRAYTQPNSGKGAALNHGLRNAAGEILVMVDADGMLGPDTLTEMVRGFTDERIGAVCGDDRTLNLEGVQTRFLTVINHLGTGLMRRALSVLHCLPIISGNTGAWRRDVLERTGPLREDTIGEDLELTWRVYRAGYRAAFAPRALVYAEYPSTLRTLWNQRVRWGRGLLQTIRLHYDMTGNPRYGSFGLYLAFNLVAQVLGPMAQVFALAAFTALAFLGDPTIVPVTFWQVLLFLSLPLSLGLLAFAIFLDRSPRDLRHAWTLPLWPFFSTMMSLVMLRAAWLELRGAESRWNKMDRSGRVSVDTGESP